MRRRPDGRGPEAPARRALRGARGDAGVPLRGAGTRRGPAGERRRRALRVWSPSACSRRPSPSPPTAHGVGRTPAPTTTPSSSSSTAALGVQLVDAIARCGPIGAGGARSSVETIVLNRDPSRPFDPGSLGWITIAYGPHTRVLSEPAAGGAQRLGYEVEVTDATGRAQRIAAGVSSASPSISIVDGLVTASTQRSSTVRNTETFEVLVASGASFDPAALVWTLSRGARTEFALGVTRTLDGAGQPLGDVRVEEQGPAGAVERSSESESGIATIAEEAGAFHWKFSRDGHLPVWREGTLVPGQVLLVPSPWLQARSEAPAALSVLNGGEVSGDGAVVRFAGGAVPAPATATLTPIGGQSLPGLLARGLESALRILAGTFGRAAGVRRGGTAARRAPRAGRARVPGALRHEHATLGRDGRVGHRQRRSRDDRARRLGCLRDRGSRQRAERAAHAGRGCAARADRHAVPAARRPRRHWQRDSARRRCERGSAARDGAGRGGRHARRSAPERSRAARDDRRTVRAARRRHAHRAALRDVLRRVPAARRRRSADAARALPAAPAARVRLRRTRRGDRRARRVARFGVRGRLLRSERRPRCSAGPTDQRASRCRRPAARRRVARDRRRALRGPAAVRRRVGRLRVRGRAARRRARRRDLRTAAARCELRVDALRAIRRALGSRAETPLRERRVRRSAQRRAVEWTAAPGHHGIGHLRVGARRRAARARRRRRARHRRPGDRRARGDHRQRAVAHLLRERRALATRRAGRPGGGGRHRSAQRRSRHAKRLPSRPRCRRKRRSRHAAGGPARRRNRPRGRRDGRADVVADPCPLQRTRGAARARGAAADGRRRQPGVGDAQHQPRTHRGDAAAGESTGERNAPHAHARGHHRGSRRPAARGAAHLHLHHAVAGRARSRRAARVVGAGRADLRVRRRSGLRPCQCGDLVRGGKPRHGRSRRGRHPRERDARHHGDGALAARRLLRELHRGRRRRLPRGDLHQRQRYTHSRSALAPALRRRRGRALPGRRHPRSRERRRAGADPDRAGRDQGQEQVPGRAARRGDAARDAAGLASRRRGSCSAPACA